MGLSRAAEVVTEKWQLTLDRCKETCDETDALITVIATQTGEPKMADMMTMATPAAPSAAPKKKAAKKKAATKKKAAKKKAAKKKAAPKKKAAKKKPAKKKAAKKKPAKKR